MRSPLLLLLLALALIPVHVSAQVVPDTLYYRFNEASGPTAANSALPGAGSPNAAVTGLAFGSGMFGNAILGTGGSSSTNNVSTGWATNLTGQSFTIEFWILTNDPAWFGYWCGDSTANSFRVFTNGAAGVNAITLRSSVTTAVDIPGALATAGVWRHVAWVFNNAASTCTGYLNGAPVVTVAQPASPAIAGSNFLVGGYSSSAGMNGGIDEFRLWLTARTPAEIAASYNGELYPNNILTATTTGGGAGDLNIALTSLSPGAAEGYLLLSSTATGTVGTGPLFGIAPDALTWSAITVPVAVGNPVHYLIGAPGFFPDAPFTVPAGVLSSLAGQVWDVVAVVLGPGSTYLGKSSVQRLAW